MAGRALPWLSRSVAGRMIRPGFPLFSGNGLPRDFAVPDKNISL
jgi:hypothetical protein